MQCLLLTPDRGVIKVQEESEVQLSSKRVYMAATEANDRPKRRSDTMRKMDPVVHFEMPYEDRERVANFYARTFGWQMHKLGQDMGDYITAATTETDENRMVKTPGAINGGFFPKKPGWPAQYPSVVVAVDDIREAMKKVADNGGEVLGEPMEIPGIGQYVSFFDTEGNRVSMLEPLRMRSKQG